MYTGMSYNQARVRRTDERDRSLIHFPYGRGVILSYSVIIATSTAAAAALRVKRSTTQQHERSLTISTATQITWIR